MRVLIDLDNTLVDRAGAFRCWAREAVDDPEWLIDADRDGYAPRAEVAAAAIERFGLDSTIDAFVERLLFEHVRFIEVYDGVVERLSGMDVVVITNGTVAQQEAKLQHVGLEQYIPTAVISERFGAKKPDPSIFLAALGETSPVDAWMVGDHPAADIAGARALGISAAWVSHGRQWPFDWKPTVIAETTAGALDDLTQLAG